MVDKNEVVGKVNEAKGKVTGDDSEELKGKLQQGFGKIKDKAEELADDVADKVNDVIDDIKGKDDQK